MCVGMWGALECALSFTTSYTTMMCVGMWGALGCAHSYSTSYTKDWPQLYARLTQQVQQHLQFTLNVTIGLKFQAWDGEGEQRTVGEASGFENYTAQVCVCECVFVCVCICVCVHVRGVGVGVVWMRICPYVCANIRTGFCVLTPPFSLPAKTTCNVLLGDYCDCVRLRTCMCIRGAWLNEPFITFFTFLTFLTWLNEPFITFLTFLTFLTWHNEPFITFLTFLTFLTWLNEPFITFLTFLTWRNEPFITFLTILTFLTWRNEPFITFLTFLTFLTWLNEPFTTWLNEPFLTWLNEAFITFLTVQTPSCVSQACCWKHRILSSGVYGGRSSQFKSALALRATFTS